ncbi:Plasma membrane ascorbate-dependent reductase CYBRD1 [Halotydeus destructor]|nr:Plasma membrane ascorbate-dependent reductase CYBRD1 [Halotydeus destructor]
MIRSRSVRERESAELLSPLLGAPSDEESGPVKVSVRPKMDVSRKNSNMFYGLFGAAQILGGLSVILIVVWITKYLGGFGWESPAIRFNWHPLFMLLGFIIFGGNGILIYRLLRNEQKILLKRIHAILNGLGLLAALFGTYAVFSFHNAANIPNLYSMHSWVGLSVLILFSGQFVAGLTAFLYPGAPGHIRSMLLPLHAYGGTAIFAMSVVAVVSGINEKAIFSLNGKALPNYSSLPSAAIVCNLLGMTVVAFALVVGFIVTKYEYKRQPLPEEQTISVPMEETQN